MNSPFLSISGGVKSHSLSVQNATKERPWQMRLLRLLRLLRAVKLQQEGMSWDFHGILMELNHQLDGDFYVLFLNYQQYGYGSIPIDTFLVGWTSIYQLFWGSLGTRVLTHPHMDCWLMGWSMMGWSTGVLSRGLWRGSLLANHRQPRKNHDISCQAIMPWASEDYLWDVHPYINHILTIY